MREGSAPATRPRVPLVVLKELRAICLELPEAYEEHAWAGTRWCVRKKNFAHVLMISGGWPPAYAKAAASDGPLCVLTFRTPGPEFDPASFDNAPFFRPVWFSNIVGIVLDDPDWDRVGRLLVASYRFLAPRKLTALLD